MSKIELSVVIPAYNEATRIKKTLVKTASYLDKKGFYYEIVVVDDGSKDNTKSVVESCEINNLRYISYGKNRGKGYAVGYGVKNARGQWVLFMDADNSTPVGEIDKMWPYRKDYEVVIGSRYLAGSKIYIHQPRFRMIASRVGNILSRILILPGISDTQCGFKMFKLGAGQQIFAKQTIFRWGFDMEILRIAKELGYKIKEAPVEWHDDEASRIQSKMVFIKTFLELVRVKLNSLRGKYRD